MPSEAAREEKNGEEYAFAAAVGNDQSRFWRQVFGGRAERENEIAAVLSSMSMRRANRPRTWAQEGETHRTFNVARSQMFFEKCGQSGHFSGHCPRRQRRPVLENIAMRLLSNAQALPHPHVICGIQDNQYIMNGRPGKTDQRLGPPATYHSTAARRVLSSPRQRPTKNTQKTHTHKKLRSFNVKLQILSSRPPHLFLDWPLKLWVATAGTRASRKMNMMTPYERTITSMSYSAFDLFGSFGTPPETFVQEISRGGGKGGANERERLCFCLRSRVHQTTRERRKRSKRYRRRTLPPTRTHKKSRVCCPDKAHAQEVCG